MSAAAFMTALFDAARSHQSWAETVLEELVRLESPSGDPDALASCARRLVGVLREEGLQVDIRSSGGLRHVRAETGSGRTALVLGHYDTVWPVGTLAEMPLRRENGRLYGPGVFDMKAGIVIALLALRALRDAGRRHERIVMLWTADEEVGSGTSRALIEEEARGADAVFVLEPALPDGGVKTARRGLGEFRIEASGIAAHAGVEPERGASAVHELVRQIAGVLALHEPSHGITINVGTIRGGSRPNVVAESAEALVDVRVASADAARRVAEAMARLAPVDPRVRITVSGGLNRPPFERTPAVEHLYMLARGLAASLGRELPDGATGGGSDGNLTAALGVPTLDGLGAHGGGAHARHEHIELDSLAFRGALLAGLLASGTMTQLRTDARDGRADHET